MSKYRHVLTLIAFAVVGQYNASQPYSYQGHAADHVAELGQYAESPGPVIVAVESLWDESMAELSQEYQFSQFLTRHDEEHELQLQALDGARNAADSSKTSLMQMSWDEQCELWTTEQLGRDVATTTDVDVALTGYACPKCHRAFKRRDNRNMHIRTVHVGEIQILPKAAKQHACTVAGCTRSYKQKYSMTRHAGQPHNTKISPVRPYACTSVDCTRSFNKKGGLVVHMKEKHVQNPRIEYECNACKKVFSSQVEIYNHRVRDHRRVFKCGVCAKVFTNQLDVNRHKSNECAQAMRRNSGKCQEHPEVDKPHKCQEQNCSKSYDKRSGLLQHIRIKHKRAAGAQKPSDQRDVF